MLLKDLIPINTILNDLGKPTCHYIKEIENEEREKIILKTFKALKEMGELSIDLDVEKIEQAVIQAEKKWNEVEFDVIESHESFIANAISKADIIRVKK